MRRLFTGFPVSDKYKYNRSKCRVTVPFF